VIVEVMQLKVCGVFSTKLTPMMKPVTEFKDVVVEELAPGIVP